MNKFQVIVLLVAAPATLYCVYAWMMLRRPRMGPAAILLLMLCILIAAPNLTMRVALWLGIGRGADLIAYLTTLSLIGCFFLVLYSHRRLRMQITELTRQIAILQMREPEEDRKV